MMAAQSPYIENVAQLMQDLERATIQFEKVNQKGQAISNQEFEDLFLVLSHINANLDSSFWESKKLAPEGVNEKIEKILMESQRFQQMHPEQDLSTRLNLDQQIASLSATYMAVLNTFDKNLRNLKKHKIGVKVEKIGESKHFQP